MTKKEGINRRDFLKIGGVTAGVIGAAGIVDLLSDSDMLGTNGEGGFLIRQHDIGSPPYEVTDSAYQRFDAKNAIFGRTFWDDEYNEVLHQAENVYEPNEPGYERIDVALNGAAVFLGAYNGTMSPMMGRHDGLLALDGSVMGAPHGPSFEGQWDHSQYSPEEVAKIVKKAALFLGASLVGIAPLDERWVYSAYYSQLNGDSGPIEFTDVDEVSIPEGQMAVKDAQDLILAELETWEGDDIKELLFEVMENIDPALLGEDAPDTSMLEMLPGSMIKQNLSMLMSMPAPVLQAFADNLELGVEIAEFDPEKATKPRYLADGSMAIPKTMTTVIALAFEMDLDGIEAAPTTQGDIPTMDGYSKMAITAGSLAQFIRGLGYNAIPCGNNTGLSVPMAVDAGLGELGRNGLLITPKYGPRVRLAKVITDLPMAFDKPISFGVKEFCEVCKKCADLCPTKAITSEDQSTQALTISNNPGVKKWAVNADLCYIGWKINGSGCGNCIRVCPFNKPEGWLHDATRVLIGAKMGALDDILVKLDDASGYGSEEPNTTIFWDSDSFMHIKE